MTCVTPQAEPWREIRLVADVIAALRGQAPAALPRARGQHVLVVPGFGTGDVAMGRLHRYLRSCGFVTHAWRLGVNLGPTAHATRQLTARLRQLSRKYGCPIHLVGWSMGGVLARSAAARARSVAGRVVTLGSPLSGDPTCSWLSSVVARCAGVPLHHRRVRRLLAQGAAVPVHAVHSRQDGVVHWRASAEGRGDIAAIEVQASHLGVVVNPEVFAAVAKALVRRSA